MVQVNLHVFVIGGYNNPRRFFELQREQLISTTTDMEFALKPRTPMRDGRWLHSACSQNDRYLFVTGGAWKADKCKDSVERYDTQN